MGGGGMMNTFKACLLGVQKVLPTGLITVSAPGGGLLTGGNCDTPSTDILVARQMQRSNAHPTGTALLV